MPTIKVNNANLYYEDSAPEQDKLPIEQKKPVMMFAHGLLWGTHMYDKQVEYFKNDYRCIAFDFRGQGKSQVTKTGYDMDTLASDAIAILEALNIKKCHFIGLSMGGYVGQRVALKRPDLLNSLILLETSARAQHPTDKKEYEKLIKIINIIGIRDFLGKKILEIMFGQTILNDKSRKKEIKKWVKVLKKNNKKGAINATRGVISRDEVLSRIPEIKLPTLIVVGDEDVPTPYPEAQEMHFAINGSKLAVLKGSGHTSPIEEPEQLNTVIETFLEVHF